MSNYIQSTIIICSWWNWIKNRWMCTLKCWTWNSIQFTCTRTKKLNYALFVYKSPFAFLTISYYRSQIKIGGIKMTVKWMVLMKMCIPSFKLWLIPTPQNNTYIITDNEKNQLRFLNSPFFQISSMYLRKILRTKRWSIQWQIVFPIFKFKS